MEKTSLLLYQRKKLRMISIVAALIIVAGIDNFELLCLVALTISVRQRLFLWSFEFSLDKHCVFRFITITATMFTEKNIIWGKFCILCFVKVVKFFVELVGILLFVKLCMPSIRTGCSAKRWLWTKLNDKNQVVFSLTIGSISRSLTRMGRKKDLIEMRSYLELLKTNTGNTLQYRFKNSCSLTDWFFWNYKNWVKAQCSLSQSARWACSRRLWRCLSFSMMLINLIPIVELISWKKSFNWILLWIDKP